VLFPVVAGTREALPVVVLGRAWVLVLLLRSLQMVLMWKWLFQLEMEPLTDMLPVLR
jgi:hypothetical protein